MKKFFIIFIFVLSVVVSCLEDLDSIREKKLFEFYDNIKSEILNDNINWIEKNSDIENIEDMKDILINNNDSLKKFILSSNGEYSVTVNYTIGDSSNSYSGYYIIRNTEFYPVYYYIRLVYKSNRWVIESVNKLPLEK